MKLQPPKVEENIANRISDKDRSGDVDGGESIIPIDSPGELPLAGCTVLFALSADSFY